MTVAVAGHGTQRAAVDRRRRWDFGILAVWLGALAVARAGVLQEYDPYWQVRAGMDNLDGAALVRPDTWSWAPVDALFAQTSPLWNDALALAYRTAGFGGFFTVALISVSAYFAVVVALARRLGARPLPTLLGVLVAVLPALAMLSPRASLVAQTLFLSGILFAHAWSRRQPRPPVAIDGLVVAAAAFVLAALGSWVHLSWLLLSPATAIAWTVIWASSAPMKGRRLVAALMTLLGAAGGILAGPYGLDAWELSRRVQAACEGVVLEWAGMFTPSLALRWAPAGLLAIAAFSFAAAWTWRRWRSHDVDARVGLVGALTVVGLPAGLAALEAIRFIGISLLLLAPVAAFAATVAADRIGARARATTPTGPFRRAVVRRWSGAHPWRVVLSIVAVVLVPAALAAGWVLGRPSAVMPAAAELPSGCRLFSDPASAGGILLLRPDVRVWIDGRADYWGHARNAEAINVLTGSDLGAPAIKGATCIVLQGAQGVDTSALAQALDSSPGWTDRTTRGARVWGRSG